MTINILSDKWAWMGKHTGYSQISKHIKKINSEVRVIHSKRNIYKRIVGKVYSTCKGWACRDQSDSATDLWLSLNHKKLIKNKDLLHILYFDSHYFFFERWTKAPKDIIATIHHPPPRKMPKRMQENLKRLSSAIVLSRSNFDRYEGLIGKGRVKFIRHGVDTEFFKPKKNEFSGEKRLLFTGQNGRNTKMFYRVVSRLSKKHPKLRFDLLVRKEIRHLDGLRQLVNQPNVTWHENLSDDELLRLYQKSYLLMMPMESCSANNAIVESLACGLPVVTTDVGGIKDYGGNSVYPVIKNNDDSLMIELVEKYLCDERLRNETGENCRKFAEQNLAFPLIAKKHLKAYEELTK